MNFNWKILTAAFLFFFLFTGHSIGQDRKFVNEFLNLGIGARSQGMMGAVSASVNDITAGYWNPAGLTEIDANFQFGAMHAEWFAGIAQFDFLGFGKKLGKKNNAFAGISLIRMGVDQIPNTFNLIGPDGRINYDNVTEFSASDYALFLSYGHKLNDNFQLGGNIKILNRNIGQFGSAWGFGFDLGSKFIFGNFQLGIVARDIPSTFTSWSFNYTQEEKEILFATGNEIPKSTTEVALPQVIVGISYSGGAKQGKNGFHYLAEFDINISNNSTVYKLIQTETVDVSPAFGVELGYNHLAYVRAGVGNLQNLSDVPGEISGFNIQPNIGLGLALGRFKIDYALANVGHIGIAEFSHIFSLQMDLKSGGR